MRHFFIFLATIFFVVSLPKNASAVDEQKLQLVVKTFAGSEFDLQKNHGKILLLNFWSYWCSECLEEMVFLEKIYQQHQAQGLEIVGVSLDQKSEKNLAIDRAKKTSYPKAMLVEATTNNFPEINAMPVTYVFNEQGVKIAVIKGFKQSELENLLLPKFEKKNSKNKKTNL